MHAPTAPTDFGYCNAGDYAYDPAKAKQLLQEAGQTNLQVHMVSPTGRYPQDFQTAQVVANYLQQVGINVDLETMAWPALSANILSPADQQTAGLKLLGIGGTTVDASTILRSLTKDTFPPRGINVSFFTSPETEQLFAQQAVNLDAASREQQLCQLEKAVWNQAPWIFLWNPKYIMAYQAGLDGLAFDYGDAEQFLLAGMHPAQ
jgi:peptide/nickel transport system substrate-binding protein